MHEIFWSQVSAKDMHTGKVRLPQPNKKKGEIANNQLANKPESSSNIVACDLRCCISVPEREAKI